MTTSSRTSRSTRRRTSVCRRRSTPRSPVRRTDSIWGTVTGFPGALIRLDPGKNPPATALAEMYEVPWNNPKAAIAGVLTARRRHRPQRRGVGVAGERPSRRASTAASARLRSTVPTPRASTARRAGRCTSSPVRTSRAPKSPEAPTRATTRGSTSSTRRRSATTCRSRRATARTRCSRWWTASSR